MKRLLLPVLLLLTACEAEPAKVEVVPAPPIEQIIAEGRMSPADRTACEAKGGVVQQRGMARREYCIIAYKDAGKVCRDDADCEGLCLVDRGEGSDGQPRCQADQTRFGCTATVSNGVVGDELCAD